MQQTKSPFYHVNCARHRLSKNRCGLKMWARTSCESFILHKLFNIISAVEIIIELFVVCQKNSCLCIIVVLIVIEI